MVRHDVNVDVDDRFQRLQSFVEARAFPRPRALVESHVFKVQRLTVKPACRRSNPICKLAWLHDSSAHQRLDVSIILGTWEPLEFVILPSFFAQNFSIRTYKVSREIANRAMETFVRQGQPEPNAHIINHPLPPPNSISTLFDIVIAQAFV